MTTRRLLTAPDVHGPALPLIKRFLADMAPADSYELRTFEKAPSSDDDWVERLRGTDGVFLGWRMPDAVLQSSPSFDAVSFLGTGIADNINLDLCRAENVSTYVVSGYGDNAVAEHAVALLLSVWNRIPFLDREMRAGEWKSETRSELRGSTLGIVGHGGIGKRVAEIATALGMRVIVWSRSLTPRQTLPNGTAVTLDELYTTSDAISVHLSFTDETVDFIAKPAFDRMKPGTVFINTARAGVVDPTALHAALETGRVIAGLDVFLTEPIAHGDELLRARNTVLTPHIGYNTTNAVDELVRQAVANLVHHFWPDTVTQNIE